MPSRWALIRGKLEERQRAGEAIPADIAFMLRPDNFSILVFSGAPEIMPWLQQLNYRPLQFGKMSRAFEEVFDYVSSDEEARDVVRKAVYQVPGFRILMDPEQVLIVNNSLAALCSSQGTRAMCVLWERWSETVMARDVLPSGEDRQIHLEKGKKVSARGAWPELKESATPDDLRSFLGTCGVPVAAVFGDVSATVYRLQEIPAS